MKTYLAVFASVLVAELGDKTQMATLLWISPKVLRTVTGLGFVAIGVWVLLT